MPRTKNFGSAARVVRRTLGEISINAKDYTVKAIHAEAEGLTAFVNVRSEHGGVWSLLVTRRRPFGNPGGALDTDVSVCFRTGEVFNSGPGIHFAAPAKVAKLAIRAVCAVDLVAGFDEYEPARRWRAKAAA